jgi:hypothetical protein
MIQDWQEGLKRVEIYIEWDQPLMEDGEVVMDEQGNLVLATDEDGNPIRMNSGKAVYVSADSGYFGGGH